jgi:hypothetical protein
MNAAAIHEEVSKQVGSFMEIMKAQPLSLALVMMNLLLIVFLFYSNSQTLQQRASALEQIVAWQRQTDTLMAGCISKEALELVLNAVRGLPMVPVMPMPVPTPQDKSSLEHLLPGPKLQSQESRPFVFPDPPVIETPKE